jgi:hypothetical protein
MTFVLVFLNCTWYIKNPFLKSKINDVGFLSLGMITKITLNILGAILEYLGLWKGTKRDPRESTEHASNGAKTPHACIDALLYRYVLSVKLSRGLISYFFIRGGTDGRQFFFL